MKRLLTAFFLFIVYNLFSQEFQLAPPSLKYNSVFFSGSATFSVVFNQPGTAVYYTLNGNEPTENDLMYKTPVTVSKRTMVRVKAIGNGYLPSETISAEFIKSGKPVKSVQYSTPAESYTNVKPDILNDDIGGIPDYRGGTWIGYNNDTAELKIDLAEKKKIKSLIVDLLFDANSWILLPERIELYSYDYTVNGYILSFKQDISNEEPFPKQSIPYVIKPAKKIKSDKMKLFLFPVKKIPEWFYLSKGNHAWLFIDEIKVY